MTEVSQEDKEKINSFYDNLEQTLITGGEVTLSKIGDCISKMPDDLKNLGGLVKKYGYYGAFLAIKESLDNRDIGPIGKYALSTGLAVLLIPSSFGILSTTLLAVGIGSLVDLSWDYIEEHKDDIFTKIQEKLAIVGMEIEETSITVNYCPLLQYNAEQAKENLLPSIQSSFATAEKQLSPLVLDLDGDGVETINTERNVHFDHENDGFAENTGWVGKDDGLLVRDLNNNGQIDDGTELFGNNSVLSSGQKAANGFEALKDLDSNNDGVFNSQDTAWNEVKVWKDTNQNGIVDEAA